MLPCGFGVNLAAAAGLRGRGSVCAGGESSATACGLARRRCRSAVVGEAEDDVAEDNDDVEADDEVADVAAAVRLRVRLAARHRGSECGEVRPHLGERGASFGVERHRRGSLVCGCRGGRAGRACRTRRGAIGTEECAQRLVDGGDFIAPGGTALRIRIAIRLSGGAGLVSGSGQCAPGR